MPSELTEENWKDADVLIDTGEFAVNACILENGDCVKQQRSNM